jgi:4-hydroxybenzoate polyprenyltransferase
MKLIIAFLRLVRSLNLFFIVLTQALFYYCVLPFAFRTLPAPPRLILQPELFWLLCLASLLIAAAGYVINDYFDLNIDRVNKPQKLVVDTVIKRRWAILWHWLLSFTGIIISFYISWKLNNWIIGLANSGCVFLLMLYSSTFKKKLLIGNLIISILTSWVILVLFLAEWNLNSRMDGTVQMALGRLFKLAVVYAGFAFIVSLVREVVKDVEDMEGDMRYDCRTMPIVWGVNVAKMFAAVWLAVLLSAIIILQFYVLQFRWWWSILYSLLFIIVPVVWILFKLYRANIKHDFHLLSGAIKLVMLTGILSMLFFKLYN